MRNYSLFAFVCLLAIVVGCSKSGEQTASTSSPNHAGPAPTLAVGDAADTVTQFLDALRRGGSDNTAEALLTVAARQECQRKGISVQPIGSPNAKFDVTRGELVPGRQDAALVHSLWTEPNPDGSNQSFEVVWALKQEPAGWKISGMIVEMPSGEPAAVDFENGDDLLGQLVGPPPEASTATAPADSTTK